MYVHDFIYVGGESRKQTIDECFEFKNLKLKSITGYWKETSTTIDCDMILKYEEDVILRVFGFMDINETDNFGHFICSRREKIIVKSYNDEGPFEYQRIRYCMNEFYKFLFHDNSHDNIIKKEIMNV